MPGTRIFPRFLAPRLREALRDTPAVLLHGPRQSGKTTLARMVGEPRGYRYVSFDDDATLAAAKADPVGFVAGLPAKSILDEVQRVPEIFTSLKTTIDRRRTPGRFILTGSANVLFVPRLADSLAGRMGILRLHPLAQAEARTGGRGFWRLSSAAGSPRGSPSRSAATSHAGSWTAAILPRWRGVREPTAIAA